MFNDRFELTAAVLEGQKTMTRRVVPEREIEQYYERRDDVLSIGFGDIPVQIQSLREAMLFKARYKVGEVVAIAQPYKDVYYSPSVQETVGNKLGMFAEDSARWNNKMFVKAELMPHHIKIAYIKVERLQDISDEDCLREGIGTFKSPYYFDPYYHLPITSDKVIYYKTPREAFAALIDKVSGKGTWDSNPWVFVYEFKLID